MENTLRQTIVEVLNDVHIEGGRNDEFNRVVDRLEAAISEKIISHEINFYTEILKVQR